MYLDLIHVLTKSYQSKQRSWASFRIVICFRDVGSLHAFVCELFSITIIGANENDFVKLTNNNNLAIFQFLFVFFCKKQPLFLGYLDKQTKWYLKNHFLTAVGKQGPW